MENVTMTPVESSNIEKVGYNEEKLYVQFKGGSTYTYDKVPQAVYNTLMNAESKGKYLNKKVKGKYTYTRIA